MKNCDAFKEEIVLYIYGELDTDRIPVLEQHLEECETCRNELEQLQSVSSAIGECVEKSDAPEKVETEIKQQAREAIKDSRVTDINSRRSRPLRPGSVAAAAVAACLTVLLGIGFYMNSGTDSGITDEAQKTVAWKSDLSEEMLSIENDINRLNSTKISYQTDSEDPVWSKIQSIKQDLEKNVAVREEETYAMAAPSRDSTTEALMAIRRDVDSLQVDVDRW